MLKKGKKGKEVIDCQRRLNELGYAQLTLDGIYGEHTKDAVERFQEASGLLVDGIVGPKTWQLLREVRPPLQSDLFEKEKYAKIATESARDPDCKKALLLAVGDLGKKETPSGSNHGKEIDHLVAGYKAYWKITSDSYPPWCAIAVSSWIKLGIRADEWSETPFKKWFGGVSQIVKWAKDNKRFFKVGRRVIKGGDIVILSRAGSTSDKAGKSSTRAGHTGFVLRDEGDRLLTIEGNVSNRVKICYRPKKTVKGIVTWS